MYFFEQYAGAHAAEWDAFVEGSKNGTFLLKRGYMDYHSDRFTDGSVMVREKKGGALVALLPANIKGKELISHGGLTYGGLIVDPGMTTPAFVDIFDGLCDHLRAMGLREFIYKTIPAIYHRFPAEEDRYALFMTKAAELYRRDTLSVMDLRRPADIQQRRKRGMKKAAAAGLTVRLSDDYAAYWAMLEANLSERHEVKPVHSLAEIQLLAGRFPDNIQLIGCFRGDEIMAGIVLYRSPTVMHAQYIASTQEGRSIGALDLLFGSVGQFAQGEQWFDFGISNEAGSVLNRGLIEFKEGFGARAVVHDFYRVDLEACRPQKPRFALGDAEIIGELPADQPVKLTVSIITYNQRDLLPALLDDVFAQVGAMDGVEVLVGDDGSRDGTQDVLRDYVAKWPGRMRAILGHRNAGICANGNRNHLAARGEYVALMAGDDRILPGKFAAQMAFLDAHPDVGLCYHDVEVVYKDSARKPWRFSQRHRMRRGDAATVLRFGSFFSAQSSMVRRSLLHEASMRGDLDFSGDTLLFIEALARTGTRIDFLPDVYLRYIHHGANVTTTAATEIVEEKEREMEFLRDLFPQYPEQVALRLSDHQFILAFRKLKAGRYGQALCHLGRSIALAGTKWSAPRIAVEEGRFRLQYFLNGR